MAGSECTKTGVGGQMSQDEKMHHGMKRGAPAETKK